MITKEELYEISFGILFEFIFGVIEDVNNGITPAHEGIGKIRSITETLRDKVKEYGDKL